MKFKKDDRVICIDTESMHFGKSGEVQYYATGKDLSKNINSWRTYKCGIIFDENFAENDLEHTHIVFMFFEKQLEFEHIAKLTII